MKLDKIDTKILSELDMNARQTNTQIARKLGVSKQVVGYRINKLIEDGVIEGFYSVINIAKFGYTFYRIWIKILTSNIEKENEMIEYLKNNFPTSWIVKSEGIHDIVVLFWCRSAFEFEKILDDLQFRYSSYVEILDITIASRIYHFKHKFLFGEGKCLVTGGETGNHILDESDKKILSILAKNSRESVNSISKKVGISPNTVRYKIDKLKRVGILLAFRTKLNMSLLGYQHFKIFLYFKDITQKRYSDLVLYLKNHSNIIYITRPIGPPNLEFEAQFKNIEELHEMVNDMRSKFSDIIKNYDTRYEVKEILINYFPLK